MHQDKKRTKGSSLMRGLGAALLMMLPALVFAQDAPPPPNKGDVSWLMTSTVLVILMTIPGLALFYGGMVRSKNVLSLLMQVMIIFCVGVLHVRHLRLLAGLHREATRSSAASARCS